MASKKKSPAPESVAASEHAAEETPKRGKVIELPGMVGEGVEKPQVDALDDAVRDYVTTRDKRIAFGVEEKANKSLILALMEKHNLGSYEVDDLVVLKKPKDATASIKVVSKADYTGDDPAPDEGED